MADVALDLRTALTQMREAQRLARLAFGEPDWRDVISLYTGSDEDMREYNECRGKVDAVAGVLTDAVEALESMVKHAVSEPPGTEVSRFGNRILSDLTASYEEQAQERRADGETHTPRHRWTFPRGTLHDGDVIVIRNGEVVGVFKNIGEKTP